MSIMWKYLDKKAATVAAIKDYDSMAFILEHTDESILQEQDRMTGLGAVNMDGMPHGHNPQAGEDRVIAALDEIDILKERYRQAKEYMDWFQPAWDQLSEDERFVLDVFIRDNDGYGSNAASYVAQKFCIEQTSAYKKKNRALDHMTVLLFGRV